MPYVSSNVRMMSSGNDAPPDTDAQRRQVAAGDVLLGRGVQHGRHAGDNGAPVSFQRVQYGLGLESGHDRQAAAVPDADIDHGREPEHVKEREHGQGDVVAAGTEQVAGDGAVHIHLEVRELGAFRLAGGTAGVDEHGGIVGVAGVNVPARPGEDRVADQLGDEAGALW